MRQASRAPALPRIKRSGARPRVLLSALMLVLSGMSFPGLAEAATPEASRAAPPPEAREDVRQLRYHMGTLWTLEARGPAAAAAVEAASDEIGRLDRLLSTYRPDSELSKVNQKASHGWVAVGTETRSLVERALEVARKSEGAFDPTVGPVVKLWGFKHLDYRFPYEQEIRTAKSRVGYSDVEVDPARGIRFKRSGLELDLGAIAKGYAVDRAVSVLRARGMTSIRVDAGGNQHVWGPPLEGERWVLGIRHPRRDGDVLGVTAGTGGGVSTSGDAERGFWKDGVRYGHVIDPRTGYPAQGVLSVTVWARDAETADALSTALYVMGPEKGMRHLAAYAGAEALWVTAGSEPGHFAIQRSAGFPWLAATPAERDTLEE